MIVIGNLIGFYSRLMVGDSNAKLYMSSECKLHFISQFCDVELDINKLIKMILDFILTRYVELRSRSSIFYAMEYIKDFTLIRNKNKLIYMNEYKFHLTTTVKSSL